MKFRHGFVSNSSSTSFVLVLPHKPTSVEELYAWMFPRGPTNIQVYDHQITSMDAAQTAYDDLRAPVTRKKVVEVLRRGIIQRTPNREDPKIPNYPFTSTLTSDEADKVWELWSTTRDAALQQMVDNLERLHPNSLYFLLTYSEHDGGLALTMERGDVFANLPNFQINQH